MRMSFRGVVLGLAGLSFACDSSPDLPTQVAVGPHRGTTIRLLADKGFVELTNEPEVKDRRSNEPTSIVAYYLQLDCKSPLDSPPTDVKFVIERGRKAPR